MIPENKATDMNRSWVIDLLELIDLGVPDTWYSEKKLITGYLKS